MINSNRFFFWIKNKLDKIEIKDEIYNKWSIVLVVFTNFMINISTCIVHDKNKNSNNNSAAQHNANEIIVIGKQFNSFYFVFSLSLSLCSLFLLVYLHFSLIEWMIVIGKMAKGLQFMANKSHWLNTSIKARITI